ncbi:ABC transporter permease [Pseudohoeflea coraliihabitans]|uniref:ABC transporter permease n=1 Tax=Pseudohoeflea coraliihabitans TaxID=2860393 RepID=A0ABS6WNL4_9HYPH|nr:ABC transporter permease [Pseudohoeflea sp. DP4N28-3]MBW3097553.1 ABC transporter permease [Pseudohoeflea sp. DP4N28-3]
MTQASFFPGGSQAARGLLARFPFMPALLILIALIVLNGVFEPNSLSYRAIRGLVSTYLALMLLAVAQTYVVYAADIDLSIGAILSLVNVSVIVLLDIFGGSPAMVLLACVAGVGIGALCGLVNGLVVAGLRLQAIVATFATSILFTGLALYVLPVAGTPAPAAFWRTYGGSFFGVPFVFAAAVVTAIVLYLLARARLITQLLAVGDDAQAAFQSGLPVTAIRIKGYVLCGVFAALAALCVTGDTASGDPLVGGKMVLNSVAAVVLGGTALSGGFGSVVGSVIGALIIGLISSLVFFVGTPSEWQNLVQGLAILIALMVGVLVGRKDKS